MKISYNWLKQYISFDLAPAETADYLTACGLEVEGMETYESIRGGLRGLVAGEVLTCEPHPDSDHLHVTTVDVGGDTPLNIVCGAPNVAKGQKVIVATIGTVLYDGEESFTIKKSKLRGVPSEGMICAEDEIGVGESHDGIMVLPEDTVVGTPAAKIFKVECDTIFEIGLTPNRSDAICHFGVARDLYAILKANGIHCSPPIAPLDRETRNTLQKCAIDIIIENKKDCPRYTGVTINNVTVKESPEWLQTRLKSIGVRPINNIVDATNYVMFEIGQPLHAFDADTIIGNQVIVKNLPEGTPFVTLDGNEIKLSANDLMICNASEGMCIAGVYGGQRSGVTEKTKNIFLESAYFNPVSIRKTSKRHNLKTDAAFRFERGCDPEITVYALRRAANIIKDIAGGLTSEITDVYPDEIERRKISLRYEDINRIAGKKIDKQMVCSILVSLGIDLSSTVSGEDQVTALVPLYKADVTRPIDLIEEILRIYGYNNIEIPTTLSYNCESKGQVSYRHVQNRISNYLSDNGFLEVMNNSLTKEAYAQHFDFINENEAVKLLNPLSTELNVMRQTLLFSGLENIDRNIKNKRSNLKLYEFGKSYWKNLEATREDSVTDQYKEKEWLSMFATGKNHEDLWNEPGRNNDFFYLKNMVENVFRLMNIKDLTTKMEDDTRFTNSLRYYSGEELLCSIGMVQPAILKYFDIKVPVCYAEIDTELLYRLGCSQVLYSPIPLFPAVKRDLALVVDKAVTYDTLEKVAYKYGSKLLKNVTLFDVYEGDKIEAGKKSYALNFVLQHSEKTLTEEDITKVMNKLITAFEREVGAKLRQ
ncbi:MAG: phenylalanine--tRNA ligase subunit beta [Bacteroidales bacterium]|nr:phenylalanine--tRNA ligase subunit beta [Bacteroidales bacterium]